MPICSVVNAPGITATADAVAHVLVQTLYRRVQRGKGDSLGGQLLHYGTHQVSGSPLAANVRRDRNRRHPLSSSPVSPPKPLAHGQQGQASYHLSSLA